jgi:cytochrome c oxidase cbb3-type subunit III
VYYSRFNSCCSTRAAWRLNAICAVTLLGIAGCELRGKPNPADRPVTPDQITDFGQLFAANCAGCHGAAGKMGPAPPLSDPIFVAIVPDEELLRVIQRGRPGTPMPAFLQANGGTLTDAQVKALADGVKSHWKSETPLEPAPPSYAIAKDQRSGPNSGDNARGLEIYQRACAGCHGPNGAGGEGSHSRVGAINAPAFLALISDQALKRLIITGRPDLGMPTFAEKRGRPADFRPLSSGDIDDLVALLAEWRSAGSSKIAQQH